MTALLIAIEKNIYISAGFARVQICVGLFVVAVGSVVDESSGNKELVMIPQSSGRYKGEEKLEQNKSAKYKS